jgi:hypothetical protein
MILFDPLMFEMGEGLIGVVIFFERQEKPWLETICQRETRAIGLSAEA